LAQQQQNPSGEDNQAVEANNPAAAIAATMLHTMKILITGLQGTLAPVVAAVFAQQNASIIAWDRQQVDPTNTQKASDFLHISAPDAIVHLAMGSAQWAAQLAAYANAHSKPFLFTSSAMVFHHQPNGPHWPRDSRTAQDDYGRYKIACEDAIQAAYAGAMIARIGYQIHTHGQGNNMLAHLEAQQQEHGLIKASQGWIPACSFMTDTALALWQLIQEPQPGLHHVDSNQQEAWTYLAIVQKLKEKLGYSHWSIQADNEYQHDQRLASPRPNITPLSLRLLELKRF
jgi:dTDP-4-dehydrorhamnose reductase